MSQTFTLQQALSVSLDAVSHNAAQYNEPFVSSLAPLGATTFRASVSTNPGNFLTLLTPTGDLTSVSPVLTYSVAKNTGVAREGEIEITYTDTDGAFVTLLNVIITQSAEIVVATTNADGDAVDVEALPAGAGVITATITLAGTGTAFTTTKSGANASDFYPQ